jgi:hypothetical protein
MPSIRYRRGTYTDGVGLRKASISTISFWVASGIPDMSLFSPASGTD